MHRFRVSLGGMALWITVFGDTHSVPRFAVRPLPGSEA